jgi:tetraacyldisaccharide 4'-kinase
MVVLKFLLLPFSLLYGIAVALRNWLYDSGVLPSAEFNKSVIAIGNLSAGGTGKSPMTEYLIRLLKEKFMLATLSRGYKRHTQGFLIAEKDSTSFQIGDEPLQFKKKFPDVVVSVDENRKQGIQKLIAQFPELKVVLLDDAFQHRRVKPGLSILLTDYSRIFYDDFLLPAGTLREWISGKKRADIIIVTKCPDNLTPVEKRIIHKKISPEAHQHVLFSHIKYTRPVALFPSSPAEITGKPDVVLFTGVSNPLPLEDHLQKKAASIIPIRYPDHHEYTLVEITQLIETFNKVSSANKVIITTEKDAMRLDQPGLVEVLHKLPLYYIPIETTFDEKEKTEFDQLITDYIIRTGQKK